MTEAFLRTEIAKLRDALEDLQEPAYITVLHEIAVAVADALRRGDKVLFCGNGGSAADAQHLAAELVGRQNFDRSPAAGLALTVDTSALTAIGNDYGFESVFARQVEALGRPGDVLIAISTSGRSANVVKALAMAELCGMVTVSFTGADPCDMGKSDHILAVPATETAKIQELHMVSGHAILALVERMLFEAPQSEQSN